MASAGRVAALCVLVSSLLLIVGVTLTGGRASVDDAWLPRYDLSAASRRAIPLPVELAEVSGLAVDGRGRLLAHHDEQSTIFVVDPETGGIVRRISLGSPELRGDFEGIAVAGNRIFLVTSAGTLYEVIESTGGGAASSRQVETGLGTVCEVEGLAYHAASAALLLPCKTMRDRRMEGRLVVYAVPLATLALDPTPRLDVAQSALRDAGLRAGFHPSAIEVHPRSGSFFLVAGPEATIVEISPAGRVLAVRQLSQNAHRQPEGLTFGPDLEMWIADEGGRRRGGMLTRYRLASGSEERQQ